MKLWIPPLTAFIFLLLISGNPVESTATVDDVNSDTTIQGENVISDTTIQGGSAILDPNTPADTIIFDSSESPRVLLSQGTLSVTRDQEKLLLPNGSTLLVGDTIETRSNQFAVIHFPSEAVMIVHPVSMVTLNSPSSLHLISADIQFESGNSLAPFPDNVTCFDTRVTHTGSQKAAASFMLQCRGQSGIILASHSGSQQLDCHNKSFQVSAGGALMGRASSSGFEEALLPDQPIITDSAGIEKYQPSDLIYKHRLHWQPIPMADQYLLQVSRIDIDENTPVHWFQYQRERQTPIDSLSPGSYKIRVAAVDYYGVMGSWSDPFYFDR